jgi:hypothetical protein
MWNQKKKENARIRTENPERCASALRCKVTKEINAGNESEDGLNLQRWQFSGERKRKRKRRKESMKYSGGLKCVEIVR